MKCNPFMASGDYNLTNKEQFNSASCSNVLEFESKEACPVADFYAIWNFFLKFYIFFGAILILIGLFEVLLGAKLMIVTIFLASTFVVITVVFIFLFQFITPNGLNNNVVWVVLSLSSLAGIITGYFIAKYNKFLIGFILGGYMGYLLGILVYNLGLKYIDANPVVKIILYFRLFIVFL
jgi:hypothetical protein